MSEVVGIVKLETKQRAKGRYQFVIKNFWKSAIWT
jgi:hypothetical protein